MAIEIPKQESEGSWNWYVKEEGKIDVLDFLPENGVGIIKGVQEGRTTLEVAFYDEKGQIIIRLIWEIEVIKEEGEWEEGKGNPDTSVEQDSGKKQPATSEKQPSLSKKQEVDSNNDSGTGKAKSSGTIVEKTDKNAIKGITQKKGILYIKMKSYKKAKKYEIYRSQYKNKKYKKIGTTKKVIYKDKKAKGGNTYYYKVRIVMKKGENIKEKIIESSPRKKKVKVYLAAPKLHAKLTPGQLKISGGAVPAKTGVEVYIKEKGSSYKKAASKYYNKKNQSIVFMVDSKQFEKRNTCYFKVCIYQKVKRKKIYSGFSNVIEVNHGRIS